ncbi:MAG: tail fiber domain-containing protein [Prevotella sp.]|nr:tail fiber domain-containing protein [Prevotella sp.]
MPLETGLDGRYAGFFQGNVKVTGTINGVVVSSSDGRLKENIEEIDDGESVLERINLLNPIKYNYKNEETDGKEMDDDMKALVGKYGKPAEQPNQVMKKKHYGFVAQELQEIYPDLVYESDNGYLAVNYTELIPIMLQSIKELNAKVEQLSSPAVRKAKAVGTETTGIDAAIADVAGMDQNVPNPFCGETDIAIYLPETVRTATLYIYDLSGKQVEQHAIEGRGNTTMTIHADRMDAGMYIYSLIADGKVVATKRMIVVK